jgi:peptidoglycan/LPS O-acetylase OafA/YrhL
MLVSPIGQARSCRISYSSISAEQRPTEVVAGRAVAQRPLASISYLRAVAAVAVVTAHATHSLLGQAGVDVFFVISGFIMWTITSTETAPRVFLLRRIIRIVPMYWLATILMAIHQKATLSAVVKSLFHSILW